MSTDLQISSIKYTSLLTENPRPVTHYHFVKQQSPSHNRTPIANCASNYHLIKDRRRAIKQYHIQSLNRPDDGAKSWAMMVFGVGADSYIILFTDIVNFDSIGDGS